MENLICSCCGAKLVPTTTNAFLTCEYCDSSVDNPYYDAAAATAAATEAAKPDFAATALATLREMGVKQKLTSIDRDCFGEPLHGVDSARRGLSIPDGEQVWFLLAHNIIILGFSDGLALTDTGLYYHCDSGEGSLSWETFITSGVACVQPNDVNDGALQVGSSLRLTLKGDKDARLAAFLVDFHNQVYHACTGETAPENWCVRQQPSASSSAQEDGPSFLDAALSGLGLLFGAGAARRTLTWNTNAHPTSHPTVRQDRRQQAPQPRPLHTQPHHRPQQPNVGKMTTAPGQRIVQRPGDARKAVSPTAPRIDPRPARPTPAAPQRPGAARPASPLTTRVPARPGTAKKSAGPVSHPRPSSSRPGSGSSGKIGGVTRPRRGGR